MSTKTLVTIGMVIGSLAGGYLPVLWGGSALSFSSIIFSGIGGILGVYLGYKLSKF